MRVRMQVARWIFSDNGGCPRVHFYKMTIIPEGKGVGNPSKVD